MTISVQPNTDELNKLVSDSMKLVTAISNQLDAATPNKTNPSPPNYWTLRAKQTLLTVQINGWLIQGVQLDLESAGQAVDTINQSTQSLNDALDVMNTIAMDVKVVSAFVDLAVAISTGQPQGIIQAGGAFISLLGKATASQEKATASPGQVTATLAQATATPGQATALQGQATASGTSG